MKKDIIRWKIPLILVIVGIALFYSLPLEDKIKLGLDLRGGVHLALEVEKDKAVTSAVKRYASELKDLMNKKEIDYDSIRSKDDTVIIKLFDASSLSSVKDIMTEYPMFQEKHWNPDTLEVTYILREKARKEIEENAIDQALETIRNRIDQFGVAEPSIQREGKNRIIVQLPGIDNPERALKLIGKTALLEFKLVDEEHDVQEALEGNIPLGREILYQKKVDKETGEVTKKPFLLKKETILTGDFLSDAHISIDPQFNQPYVSLSFNKAGSKIFARVTEQNVGKRLAIILDNNVYSAPVIREKIPNGRAQITGSFTEEEARDLAIVLRAGSLPAPIKVQENRTVGPSLGQDSINQGLKSIIIGGLLVLVFMVIYYRVSGIVANIALLLNMVLIGGALAYFRATLTLPGIAGIILTIGMAVDANVLIFERIREELRQGKTVRLAIENGFSKAFLTILDANLTTIIAAIILFQYGTGPVKGFAITLSIGILASMFTAIFVCRVIFDLRLARKNLKKLSI
jgi:preprotein translocase subunit SecD